MKKITLILFTLICCFTLNAQTVSIGETSYNTEDTDVLNITIENLGIRNGNTANNGGGINVDKVTGLITLKNLIIENNHSAKNGGALGLAGSKVDIIECTIKNNSSTLDGGAVLAAPNNAAAVNSVISILMEILDSVITLRLR